MVKSNVVTVTVKEEKTCVLDKMQACFAQHIVFLSKGSSGYFEKYQTYTLKVNITGVCETITTTLYRCKTNSNVYGFYYNNQFYTFVYYAITT